MRINNKAPFYNTGHNAFELYRRLQDENKVVKKLDKCHPLIYKMYRIAEEYNKDVRLKLIELTDILWRNSKYPAEKFASSKNSTYVQTKVNVDDTIFFLVDEWNRGEKFMESGTIIYKTSQYVTVCYLSGYRSRTDNILYNDIHGKLNMSMPWVEIPGWSGHIETFSDLDTKEDLKVQYNLIVKH